MKQNVMFVMCNRQELFLAVSATDVRESVSHSPLQFIVPLVYTSRYFEMHAGRNDDLLQKNTLKLHIMMI